MGVKISHAIVVTGFEMDGGEGLWSTEGRTNFATIDVWCGLGNDAEFGDLSATVGRWLQLFKADRTQVLSVGPIDGEKSM